MTLNFATSGHPLIEMHLKYFKEDPPSKNAKSAKAFHLYSIRNYKREYFYILPRNINIKTAPGLLSSGRRSSRSRSIVAV